MFYSQRGLNIYELIKRPKGATQKNLTDRQKILRGKMSFDVLDELERNNQERAKKMIKDMGEKWAHHSSKHIKRIDGKVYK